jgi:hypothetical protein
VPTYDLHIALIQLPHPYAEHHAAHLEAWGRVLLTITGPGTDTLTLLDTQWNLDALAEWFAEQRGALHHDALNINGHMPRPDESLAQARRRLLRRQFAEDDGALERWHDALWAYDEGHWLYRGFQGSRFVRGIVIGLNHGHGEISRCDDEAEWVHAFDMDSFCRQMRRELMRFIAAWGAVSKRPDTRARAEVLLRRLSDTHLQEADTPG